MKSPFHAEDTFVLLALDRALRAARRSHASTTGLENARRSLADAARAETRARQAAEQASAELDDLMARIANGEPSPAEHFLDVSARHLEASSLARSASAGADRARRLASEILSGVPLRVRNSRDAAPASRRIRSPRSKEPVTQRSPRLLGDVGPRSEPMSQRDSAPPA
ncbi:MAG: hypothetical protein HOV80_11185 [Polyangiaceae bacterium]|nr:hypothetical protein [Polyangiaceae bacterium]